ncbi:MAG TPA: hypothetical protein VL327_03910 [Pyrinomonadaceae bacterium]|jgi:hypothetical protein|nr:hypothetical protein [Pyrinomonadaceae bacterium]
MAQKAHKRIFILCFLRFVPASSSCSSSDLKYFGILKREKEKGIDRTLEKYDQRLKLERKIKDKP